VGIAPFRRTLRSLSGNLRYSIIEPVTNGNTDYSGIIMAGNEKECMSKIFAYLFAQKDWDIFLLPDLPQGSPTLELVKSSRGDLPRFSISEGWICPYITIPDSKEKLLMGLSRRFRRGLQRSLRKLEREHGRVELKRYCELDSLEEGLDVLFSLHQKRWTLRGETGVFDKQEMRSIVLQTAKLFAEKNWARLYFLTVNNRIVAAEYALEYGGRMYGHLCGFDPGFSKYSVGNLLLWKVLDDCVEKGISEFDFMQGNEAYKFDWTNKYRRSMNVRFVNDRFSSKLMSLIVDATGMLEFYTQKILPNKVFAASASAVLRKVFCLA
jgi:hypothetical protein